MWGGPWDCELGRRQSCLSLCRLRPQPIGGRSPAPTAAPAASTSSIPMARSGQSTGRVPPEGKPVEDLQLAIAHGRPVCQLHCLNIQLGPPNHVGTPCWPECRHGKPSGWPPLWQSCRKIVFVRKIARPVSVCQRMRYNCYQDRRGPSAPGGTGGWVGLDINAEQPWTT